jgi:hypothetical protein
MVRIIAVIEEPVYAYIYLCMNQPFITNTLTFITILFFTQTLDEGSKYIFLIDTV